MAKKMRAESADTYATEAEITDALKSLSPTDMSKVEQFASFRAWALAGRGLSVDGEDLLHEAMERTLSGKRRWSKRVEFVDHLIGAVRSISSHAAKKLQHAPVVSLSPPSLDSDDEERTPWWDLESMMPDPERIVSARLQLEEITATFANSERILLIVDGMETGMTGPEIQNDLQLSATEYNTAVKQMRRLARRKAG